jgi:hypothetical protein
VILFEEDDLPTTGANGEDVSIIAPIDEAPAGRWLHLAFEEGDQVMAVEVDLEGFGAYLVTFYNRGT